MSDEAIVINRLLRWAKWKMQSGVALGYKSHVNFVRLAGGNDMAWDDAVDHECVQTNEAVDQLPELHRALIRVEYLSMCIDEQHKAHAFGCCIRSFRQWRRDAHNMIGNLLNIRLTMVPIYEHNSVKFL
ncbi:MAG: hypothetical protein LV471_11030 [Nitrosomonas sp.]|nr:hypothetical protein [Nitrosomonas sp.]